MIVSDKVCLSIALTSNLSYHLPWLKKFPEKGFRTMAFLLGFPGGTSGKEPDCQCRRCKRLSFSPCLGKIPQRRLWQPTPVFLPRESHGQRSLTGYSPQSYRETDMTEATQPMHTFLWEDMSLGRQGEFRESHSLHLLLGKCLQLKIINSPKWHIWGLQVQNFRVQCISVIFLTSVLFTYNR